METRRPGLVRRIDARSAAAVLALCSGACSLTSLDGLTEGSGGGTASSTTPVSVATGVGGTAATTGGGGGGGQGASTGGSGGGDGGGAASTGSAASSGGAGGAGGGGPRSPFVDRELLVRYHLDEAADGVGPELAHDAAADPLDLELVYGANMAWEEADGHRGLRWLAGGVEGAAIAPIDGTKVEVISGTRAGTIEAVFDVDEAVGFGSRLVHIGVGNNSSFSLAVATTLVDATVAPAARLQLRVFMGGQALFAQYDLEVHGLGRVVAHAVLETTLDEPEDRVRMYIDGVRVARNTSLPDPAIPAQDAALDVLGNSSLVLGNREDAARSPVGSLFYGAVYEAALTDPEIAANVAVLLVDDDRP